MKKYEHLLYSAYLKMAFILFFLCCSKSEAAIRYVNSTNLTPAAPYTSWATAGTDLQAVINQCVAGDDIWVVAGTYIPNRRADATGTVTVNDRDNAFVLKSGVRIFGGFNGTETATSQRNFALNTTILSGDLGTTGNTTDNCYHVVVSAGPVSGTSLNGFHIRYGNANGSGNITVNAISMGRGSGAGMRINSSSPTISNCVFSANSTTNNGGGIVCDGSSPAITNCLFSGNTAVDAGGIYNVNVSAPDIVNCSFSGNNATTTGGAIRNSVNSDPAISNCILWGNLAGGVANAIYNSDVASVPDVNYSLVEGGYTGTANVNADPLFVNPVAATFAPTLTGDYHVQKCSPALNSGSNAYVPGSVNNDLDYTPRINYGRVDMGSYEKQLVFAVPDAGGIIYVDYTKSGNGNSWVNALSQLAEALIEARYNTDVKEIWVAKGTYKPRFSAGDGSSYSCTPSVTNRDNSFVLAKDVKVYGGFAGGEADTSGRDFIVNETILSGDLGAVANTDNCYHVVIAAVADIGTAEVNGFSITAGNANGGSTTAVNTIPVERHNGAAIYVATPLSTLTIQNCSIHTNSANVEAGGVFSKAYSTAIINACSFSNNILSISGNGGAAIYNETSTTLTISNCSFTSNIALTSTPGYGGAILNSVSSNVNITNCSFISNQSNNGGAIHNNNSVSFISDCVFNNNSSTGRGGAISNVAASNVNIINSAFFNNNSTSGGSIDVGTNCSADIRGCSFSGNHATFGGCVFNGNASVASINTCSFTGNSAGVGGCIINAYCNSDIDSCYFINNTSTADGGAINNNVANAVITNSVFDGNSANQAGGAIYSWDNSDVQISRCSFISNEANDEGGGVANDQSDCSLDSCIFESNAADVGGGMWNYSTPVTLLNCEFNNNNALFFGGAGYNEGFSPITATGCKFIGNTATGNGGAIVNSVAGAAVSAYERCLFENNLCTSPSGKGGAVVSDLSPTIFSNCFIRGNQAGEASAIYFIGDDLELVNCQVSGNKSSSGGPAIHMAGTTAILSNCTIAHNKMLSLIAGSAINAVSSSNLIINNSIIWGNEGTIPGANPITFSGSTVTVNYSLIEGGFAGTGNINTNPLFLNPIAAASAPVVTGNYHIKTCSPAINTGSNALIPPGITTDLDSLSRIKFTTVDMGAYEKHLPVPDGNGIVYVDSSNTINEGNGNSWASAATELADALKAAITDNTIEEIWVAKGTYKPLYLSTDNGTTLACSNSNRDNSFVLRPNVKLFGGFAGGETDTIARDFTANQSTLSGDLGVVSNGADNSYHVLIASGAVGNAGIDGFNITNGHADANSNYTLNGNIVYRDYGGGIYIRSSSPFVSQCKFTANYALDYGGAFAAFDWNASFLNNLFSSNIAGKKGGAVSLQSCTSSIRNSHFAANSVNGPGPNNLAGGLYAENTILNVYNSSFISNSVLNGDGGGVVNELSAGSVFSSCIFSSNTASIRAGGYYNLSSVSALHNSVFTGNSSGTGGGAGVYNSLGASLTGTNNTISGNNTTGNGGGLLTASPCIVGNTIIHNNTATISSNNIYSVFVTPTVSNSIIQGGYAGTGNYDIDPLFVAPESPAAAPTIAGDYRLQSCSPALNLGDNNFIPPGLTKDLDSLDRIKYTTVDMGAYELQTIDLATTIWKGFNSNWNDKINWCGGYIPYDTTNVTVPGTSNNPLINAGFDNEVKNISLANSTSIGIANTSKFTINGTYTNLGCTITNNGTWVMAGTAASQTFPGTLATVSAMNNLEVNNPSGLKLDKSFELTGTLTPTDGNINVDNATITLNSDATATARVAAVPSGVAFSYTGTGKFEVERFIPPHRAWRLLTAPLNTATNLTINQAWQEGVSNANRLAPVNPAPGFGTTITKSTTYSITDGYDQGSTNTPSIRYYNGTNWGGFPSGTIGTTPGANNGLINDQQGYMLFVRGDRSIQVAGTGVTATVTTLRPKGQLKTGPQTIVCNGWTVIGNPYASPVNFHQIVLDNPGLPDAFYVWDANLAGSSNVGGWVSYGSYNGGSQTYTVTPLLTGSSFANNKGDISSGSAFMINYSGAITINENHKSTLGDNVLYRPSRQLSINLYVVNADTTLSLNDGIAIKMDASSRAANAEKNKNFTENLAIAFDNKFYAIQNRPRPNFNDTIFISSGQMKQRNYVLEIKADELNMPNQMKAFLEDTYLSRYLPVALEGSTRYYFTVNADSGSSSAARFRLLFKKSARFKQVHAAVKERDIEVQWEMEDDFGIEQYEVERSLSGIDFTVMMHPSANGHQPPQVQDKWLDRTPATGTYYYRIKATGMDGKVLYSDVAKACMVENGAGMYVYPNPVTGNTINLRLNKQPPGRYSASFTNHNGQSIFTQQWQHNGGFVTKTFQLPSSIAAGMYQLEILKIAGKKEVMLVEIQR